MSSMVAKLYKLLDDAGFYVDYRGEEDSDRHRLLVARPELRKELGQPNGRPGEPTESDDRINVLDGDVIVMDVDGPLICLAAFRCAGGYGSGDYQNLWSSPEDAFEDAKALIIDCDIRMQAKDSGSRIARRPGHFMEDSSMEQLKQALEMSGFQTEDRMLESRNTTSSDTELHPSLQVSDGGDEHVIANIHPRGFYSVRTFESETNRWFGDFEHYWLTKEELIADVDDFLRHNHLRQKALIEGAKHAANRKREIDRPLNQ